MTQRNEDGNIDLSKYLPLVNKYNKIVHAYALCEVKVAGYRPSSILRFLDEDKVKNMPNVRPSWPKLFSRGTKAGNPEGAW